MSWAPLAPYADVMLLVARLVVGVVMVYYGWPKVRDPAKHLKEFEQTGFKPASFWGSIILVVEFFGGLAMLLGVVVWAAAALLRLRDADGHDLEDHQGSQAVQRLFVRPPAPRALPAPAHLRTRRRGDVPVTADHRRAALAWDLHSARLPGAVSKTTVSLSLGPAAGAVLRAV